MANSQIQQQTEEQLRLWCEYIGLPFLNEKMGDVMWIRIRVGKIRGEGGGGGGIDERDGWMGKIWSCLEGRIMQNFGR